GPRVAPGHVRRVVRPVPRTTVRPAGQLESAADSRFRGPAWSGLSTCEGRISAGVGGIEAGPGAPARSPEMEIGLFLGRPASLAFGVRKEDDGLLAALNEFVTNVRHTSTWSRLAVKYFGESAPEILKKARGT